MAKELPSGCVAHGGHYKDECEACEVAILALSAQEEADMGRKLRAGFAAEDRAYAAADRKARRAGKAVA